HLRVGAFFDHASFGPQADTGRLRKERVMPTHSLPSRPDLDQLKRQAKELKRDHEGGKVSAAARIAANHPRLKGQPLATILKRQLSLAAAQLVIAREYGFRNWAYLK